MNKHGQYFKTHFSLCSVAFGDVGRTEMDIGAIQTVIVLKCSQGTVQKTWKDQQKLETWSAKTEGGDKLGRQKLWHPIAHVTLSHSDHLYRQRHEHDITVVKIYILSISHSYGQSFNFLYFPVFSICKCQITQHLTKYISVPLLIAYTM